MPIAGGELPLQRHTMQSSTPYTRGVFCMTDKEKDILILLHEVCTRILKKGYVVQKEIVLSRD